jgi:hypothetical protein
MFFGRVCGFDGPDWIGEERRVEMRCEKIIP